ncbi:AfsR/SARP family transcriptional regulator [Amycolatopsis silviterrae]|uniref:BTAD domain-containing putative transcriptional regulator n=1 Tax=Amycolatopsis silviterrae TaxID=1656914 RepID=A0ABW5H2F7_9PSEU
MRVDVLGPLTIAAGPRVREITQAKVGAILAVLALSPGAPVSSTRLIEEVWSGKPVRDARNTLQANVKRLRRIVGAVTGRRGDELIRTVGGGYLLRLPARQIDARAFAELADQGAGLAGRDPARAAHLLRAALELWRGPALLGLRDVPLCRLEAAFLDERRLGAREDLISARLALGEHRELIAELTRLTAAHPERDRFGEQLMLALYRAGRQTEALNVFHGIRRRLAAESGLEPGRGIRRLHQAILAQDDRVLAVPPAC